MSTFNVCSAWAALFTPDLYWARSLKMVSAQNAAGRQVSSISKNLSRGGSCNLVSPHSPFPFLLLLVRGKFPGFPSRGLTRETKSNGRSLLHTIEPADLVLHWTRRSSRKVNRHIPRNGEEIPAIRLWVASALKIYPGDTGLMGIFHYYVLSRPFKPTVRSFDRFGFLREVLFVLQRSWFLLRFT